MVAVALLWGFRRVGADGEASRFHIRNSLEIFGCAHKKGSVGLQFAEPSVSFCITRFGSSVIGLL